MEKDERGDHYAVKAEHLAPAKITCKCGAIFTGDDAIGLMRLHMQLHDTVGEFEKNLEQLETLERRNVFDQDEESP
jgi:hypothetical protein